MSELANVNLEDNTEVVGGTLTAPDPPPVEETKSTETPPPAGDPDEAEPDGTIEASGGVKFVPLDAVKAERGRRKESEAKLKEKDQLIEQYKTKAEQFDQAAQYLEQAKPIIETLKQRPDLVALAKNPPPVQTPAGPLTEDEAIDMAKDLDLYKSDGTPDVARAQKIAKRQEALADRKASQLVAPLHQERAAQASEFNRRAILNLKDKDGNAVIDPDALNTVWRVVDPAESAKPEVATTLYRLALGLMAEKGMNGTRQTRTTTEPVVPTESIGGGKPGPETLNSVGQAFQRASGMSQKDYTAIRESVKVGESNILE